MSEFSFDDLNLQAGMSVLITRDPAHHHDVLFGIINVVKPPVGAIDAEVQFPGGRVLFTQLWHADDPRIKSQPDRFREMLAEGRCGMFVLTPYQKELNSHTARLATLEKRVATLDAALDAATNPLGQKTNQPAPTEPTYEVYEGTLPADLEPKDGAVILPPVKRSPGRPRKALPPIQPIEV